MAACLTDAIIEWDSKGLSNEKDEPRVRAN